MRCGVAPAAGSVAARVEVHLYEVLGQVGLGLVVDQLVLEEGGASYSNLIHTHPFICTPIQTHTHNRSSYF